MNTKQLFFISLIILSVAMGMNWFKNRPARPKKTPPKAPRQAISLNDLQLQEKDDEKEEKEDDDDEKDGDQKEKENKEGNKTYEGEVEEETEEENEGENEDENKEENGEEKPNSEIASGTTELNASDTQTLDNPLKDDPIMKDYFQLTRNPFETSPYAQLVEKLRLEAELAARPKEEVKEEVIIPKIMNAKFTGTIETARGPKAIVDGGLYEKGNELNGCIVKEIKMNVILLESETDKWLLPKTGVTIEIDKDTGEYNITDNYD